MANTGSGGSAAAGARKTRPAKRSTGDVSATLPKPTQTGSGSIGNAQAISLADACKLLESALAYLTNSGAMVWVADTVTDAGESRTVILIGGIHSVEDNGLYSFLPGE